MIPNDVEGFLNLIILRQHSGMNADERFHQLKKKRSLMQQTSVTKCTEPNKVMNALHNYGALPPCLNTTAHEILKEKYCIGPKICVSFISPNCFINTFSF